MHLPRPILRACNAIRRELNRDRVAARRREIREARLCRIEATLDEALARQAREVVRAQSATFAMAIAAAAMVGAVKEAV